MITNDPRPALLAHLDQVSDWLNETTLEMAWTAPQGEKWTIEQEFNHLLRATYGLVKLYGEPARANWRPADRTSRTYDDVVAQYKAALPLLPPGTNAIASGDPKSLATQRLAWQQTLADVAATLPTVSASELTDNTVWKHPLLGPVTGLEMLYFSDYHTGHHLAIMRGKQGLAR